MSLVLRHQPQKIDLKLDEQGWANTADLIDKIEGLDLTILKQVVETNAKKRFAFNADETKIRASQGHSIDIDLGYEPVSPPSMLYHGTAEQYVTAIQLKGLLKRKRQHVHLSKDVATASQVGKRHGKLILLEIDTQQMEADGYLFYLSENKVWLTDHVPAIYITFPS
jgi:putative RNA 2'-phosphotransferase